jgi:hypothetical protein
MGKAADNEVRKIRARFFNNLSVGCALIGLAFLQASFYLPSWLGSDWLGYLRYVQPIILLWLLAWGWSSKAKKIAGEIED